MRRFSLLFPSVLAAILLLSFSTANAQEKMMALGSYDFYHYYEYQELTDYLHDIQEAFPNLTRLLSIYNTSVFRSQVYGTLKRILKNLNKYL